MERDRYECDNGLRFTVEKDPRADYKFRVFQAFTVGGFNGPEEELERIVFEGTGIECADFIKNQAQRKDVKAYEI